MLDLHKTFAAAALMAAGVLALQPQAASAESVLRIAITAGDIPDWTGQPDQGFEGYRFVGFALYEHAGGLEAVDCVGGRAPHPGALSRPPRPDPRPNPPHREHAPRSVPGP